MMSGRVTSAITTCGKRDNPAICCLQQGDDEMKTFLIALTLIVAANAQADGCGIFTDQFM